MYQINTDERQHSLVGFRLDIFRFPSFPQKRESSQMLKNGIPAVAGMTD